MIRILHQTWRNHDIPEHIYPKVWRDSWRDLNPGWEYKFWTDEDNERLVADHYPEFLKFYRSIDRGVIRSDVARVLYLHRHGGLYVDMDFICLKPMEPLIAPHAKWGLLAWHGSSVRPLVSALPNAWMYSPPGGPFWIRFLERARIRWESGDRIPENIAGPNRLFRFHEARKASGLKTVRCLDPGIIYPYVWSDPDSKAKARSLDWRDLDALRAAYPDAHAATRWTHNW